MGGCVSTGLSPAEARAVESRNKDIVRFQETFDEDFAELELQFGTICHVFLVGFAGVQGAGNGITGEPELMQGAITLRDHPILTKAAQRALGIADIKKKKLDTYHSLTGAFLIAAKTVPQPYDEQLPDPTDEKSKVRQDYDVIERFGEELVKGNLISGAGRIKKGIDGLKKTYEPWAQSISSPIKTGGPRPKQVGEAPTGLIPQAKNALEKIKFLRDDIANVQQTLLPFLVQWIREWLANPRLHQHRHCFNSGAFNCFKEHFNREEILAWDREAEKYRQEGSKKRDEIYRQEYDAFVAARNQYLLEVFRKVQTNIDQLLPEYEEWKKSQEAVGLNAQTVSGVTAGTYVTLTAPTKMHFSTLPGYYNWVSGVDDFEVDLSGDMGAQQPMAKIIYSEAIKEDLTKINLLYGKAVEKAKAEIKTPGNGFVIKTSITSLTPFEVVGRIGAESAIAYSTTYRGFSSEEERIKRGDFQNEEERLDAMRSFGTGPSINYNGSHYHESSHRVNATKVAMEGLYRKPTVDTDLVCYLRFGGKSCLDGLENLF